MSQNEIMEVLKKLLLDIGKPKEVIDNMTMSSNIKFDLGLDSVALVYLMFQLQNIYQIEFKGVSPNDFKLVSDFINYLAPRIK